MTFIASLMLKLSLLTIAVGGVFIGRKCLKMKDDSFIEEVVEKEIKYSVGLDIDLSPDTPEEHDEDEDKLVDITADYLNGLAEESMTKLSIE